MTYLVDPRRHLWGGGMQLIQGNDDWIKPFRPCLIGEKLLVFGTVAHFIIT